jgi:hypothetical protein
MKSLKQLVLAAFSAALVCTALQAQSVDMRATIPFAFHAGPRLMPAGEYMIAGAGPWVALRAEGGSAPAVAIVLTNNATGADSSRNSRVEFHRYGNEYFLSKIWNSFSREELQVPPVAREKELAKRGGAPVQNEVIVAGKK